MQDALSNPDANTVSFRRLCATLSTGAAVVSLLLSGCAVGPDYRRPVINTPAQFRSDATNANASGASTASTNTLAEVAWWEIYQDPALQTLIRTALTNNHDLRMAIARVEQARSV